MAILAEKNRCSGCGSCAVSCPKDCIHMENDEFGFRYPVVDSNKCIQCNQCIKKCPVITTMDVKDENRFIAAKLIDLDIRQKSTSGGVFTVLAQYCLQHNGIVCGAVYDSAFQVVHVITKTETQIEKMRGAKYVQSRSEHVFSEIKDAVESGRWTLYSGTPCQVAALRAYLGKDYDKLILVDIVCHGVPSPLAWEKYLESLENNSGSKLKHINLRSKVSGWSKYNYSTEFVYEDENRVLIHQNNNCYMKGFVSNLYLRPSCSNCSFKGVDRVSDFTLGDYWGIWNQYPDFDDNKGTSMVIIHGEKGEKIWKLVEKRFEFIEVTEKEAIQENQSTMVSSNAHSNSELFWQLINQDIPFNDVINRCLFSNKHIRLWKRVFKRIIDFVF